MEDHHNFSLPDLHNTQTAFLLDFHGEENNMQHLSLDCKNLEFLEAVVQICPYCGFQLFDPQDILQKRCIHFQIHAVYTFAMHVKSQHQNLFYFM